LCHHSQHDVAESADILNCGGLPRAPYPLRGAMIVVPTGG